MADQDQQIDNSFLDNADLTGVEISRPIIADSLVRSRIGDLRITVDDKGQRRLNIPLTLEEPATSVDGKPVNVGFQHTDSILITPTGGLTQEIINEKLARFQTAALRTKTPGKFAPLDQYSGKEVLVKFGNRTGNDGEIRQDVKRYLAVKD